MKYGQRGRRLAGRREFQLQAAAITCWSLRRSRKPEPGWPGQGALRTGRLLCTPLAAQCKRSRRVSAESGAPARLDDIRDRNTAPQAWGARQGSERFAQMPADRENPGVRRTASRAATARERWNCGAPVTCRITPVCYRCHLHGSESAQRGTGGRGGFPANRLESQRISAQAKTAGVGQIGKLRPIGNRPTPPVA